MSGHGNVNNAAVWGAADVLIGAENATIPVGLAEPSALEWEYVGLLDGDQGFAEGLEVQSTDHDAWGFGVFATTYKGQKTTKTFTALESNSTVMGLVYDTSDATFDDEAGTFSGTLKVKDLSTRVRIMFRVYSGDREERYTSAAYATIAPTNAGSQSETSKQTRTFTATIVPNSDKELWEVAKGVIDGES